MLVVVLEDDDFVIEIEGDILDLELLVVVVLDVVT